MKGLLLGILITSSCLLNTLNVYSQQVNGTITGPLDVCSGTTVQYTVTVSGSSAVSGFTWNAGATATILSGQGSKTVTLKFNQAGSGFMIYVSGNGLNTGLSPIHVTAPASAPAAITGPSIVCTGSTAAYNTSPSASSSMTGFTWYASDESSINSPTSSSAVITFPNRSGLTSTTINFFTFNGVCGSSPTVSKTITYMPLNPAVAVSNNGILCPGGAVTLTAVSGYTYYNFFKNNQYVGGSPTGIYSASAAGSYTVSVISETCSTNSNPIAVTAFTSVPAALTISGTSIVCPGDQGVAYTVPGSVDVVPTSYVWSVPAGATIASGQNSNSIMVNYSSAFNGGAIGVYGTNCVGNGPSSTFAVSRVPAPMAAATIIGPTQVCIGQSGVSYSLSTSVTNATGYAWTIPAGANLLSGQNTTSITVAFSATSSGNISVAGTNCNGVTGSLSTLAVAFNNSVAASNVEYSVDHATGTLNASLGLFSVQNGDVGVSGVMSYTGSGVTISSDDGWLGQNWALSVQSFGVFRDMRNLPDDYSGSGSDTRKGWLFGSARGIINNPSNFNLAQDNDLNTCADELPNYNTLNILTYDQDTEPDAFHVSAPGLSLDFYFDENRVPHTVPLQDVVITPFTAVDTFRTSTTTGPITSFKIKDSKGVIYTFSEIETLTENILQASQYYFVRRSNQHHRQFTYTTSWRLTSINSPIYGSITMTYTPISLSNELVPNPYPAKGFWAGQGVQWDLRYNYRYPLVTSNPSGAGASLAYTQSSVIKIPAWITSSTTDVQFVSTPRYAGSPMQRLTGINIYDKREGSAKLVRNVQFSYLQTTSQRAFLSNVTVGVAGACTQASYGFEYNNDPGLPDYSSTDKDEWGLYKVKDGSYIYDETAVAGSLRKVIQPLSGYAVFFYQTHDYWNGTSTVKGGGIRIRKVMSYDAVSSDHDIVQEFYYTAANGQSSGKLQHKAALSFSVTRNDAFNGYPAGTRYRQACGNSVNCPMFTLQGDQDMSPSSSLNGSVVAYERVTVKTLDGGQSVYEYDLPASADDVTANSDEWTPSKVLIARASTGTSQCFEIPNITEGFYKYPFPVNPNYDFARGLLKKVTHFDINGVKVSDAVYTYQRVYGLGNSAIRKIYGLAMEELPTYYFNGTSYVDGKMFLYSRYQIFTDVKIELSTQTETVYNNPTDLTQNIQTKSSYFYTSPNHRELSQVESKNSDGSLLVNALRYTTDYNLTAPGDAASVALARLKAAHRMFMVESISSKVLDPATGVAKFVGGSLTIFQAIGKKVFPYKKHSFVALDGASSFTLSSVTGGSFQYDSKYVLQKTYTGFDSYGNVTSAVDRGRNISSVAYGYSGTLPIVTVSNAGINEIAYSGFDTSTPADFVINGFTPTYSVGRSGSTSKALNLPAGSANTLTLPVLFSNNKSSGYVLSFWIKSPTPGGTLTITVNGSSPSTITRNFTASTDYNYKYYTVNVPKSSTSFTITLWSNASIQVDDLSFYPAKADIASSTYGIPQGKTSDTDSRGASNFYDSDPWGRPIAVYDRDRNLVKKYDYQVRP